MSAPAPVFAAPWHAEAFAISVSLEVGGAFTWSEWTKVFGAVLAEHGKAGDLDGGDDYFYAWVVALERICTAKGIAGAGDLEALRRDWERAYLSTPHGAPVRIDG
ncbi:nitrile hydratase accessory protein [Antarctobacter heliothermus]|uniref:Nitrile hydratase accessory protein n=1 Tax=Antarctobacter heliothermus TaxID=74033 RepID=A0A239I6X1_9RHOB|nr:nitrile hydratase accessory protein [Antarctobacter heliothermus]SNS89297.1 nitrile hydratase accessory protein [Antarctobacter heliothermus]